MSQLKSVWRNCNQSSHFSCPFFLHFIRKSTSRIIFWYGGGGRWQGEIHKIIPHNPDFWKFQKVPISKDYKAIVINATIFPSSLFEQALFDEHLRYGSEEIDIRPKILLSQKEQAQQKSCTKPKHLTLCLVSNYPRCMIYPVKK